MNTKLTLNVDAKLIQAGKLYAEKQKTSLSRIISTYLRSLKAGPRQPKNLSPIVEELSGSMRWLTGRKTYSMGYSQYLSKKHR